jgi:hypothetical protein
VLRFRGKGVVTVIKRVYKRGKRGMYDTKINLGEIYTLPPPLR